MASTHPTRKTYIELIDAHSMCDVCASTRNYCRCDAVILDPWIMSDGLDLARWKENAHFLPLYLQQNDCWVSSDEITSWFFPHLHHWISILWVYIWTPLTRDQSRGDGARDPFHSGDVARDTFHCMLSTLLLPVPPNPSTSWDFFLSFNLFKKKFISFVWSPFWIPIAPLSSTWWGEQK